MISEEDSFEEDEYDMDTSENEGNKETYLSNESIQDLEKTGTLENVFFQILPPIHANSCTKVFVYLPLHTPIYFKGKLKIIRIISGSVECLGSIMTNNSISGFGQNIFSPKGYSLLSLSSITHPSSQDDDQKKAHRKYLKSELKNIGLKKDIYSKIVDHDDAQGCFLEIANLDGPEWAKILEKYLSHSPRDKSSISSRVKHSRPMSLFRRDNPLVTQHNIKEKSEQEKVEELLDITLYDSCSYMQSQKVPRLFKSNPDWDIAMSSILNALASENKNPRLVVAGGKGVGKSTFTRFIINRLLQSNTKMDSTPISTILYIDLDPGQAEFTIPGCLSITKVSRPIIGPNFCHMDNKKEYCEYFGEVNVSNMPRSYDGCVRRIFRYCENDSELKNMPWLINTMGFTSGIGAKMMSTVLSLSRPGVFVELRSRFAKKNYKINLKSHVDKSCQSQCEFLQFNAIPESISAKDMRAKDLWGIPEPKKLRDITILSYFGQCISGLGNENLRKNLLRAATPYVVSWDDVAVQVLHTTISSYSIPKVFNMSLVGLGQILNKNLDITSVRPDDKVEHPTSSNISLNPKAPEFVPGRSEIKSHAEQNTSENNVKNVKHSNEHEVEPLRPPKLLPHTQICRNFGFGFVRGIDTQKRLFYVVTPLPLEEMQFVNCLTMGAVTLPNGIIGSQAVQIDSKKNSMYSKRTSNLKRMTKYQQSGYNHEWQKDNNAPYLATKPDTSLNHSLYSSPFSEPWQRYSKPKFQESIDQ